MKTKHLVPLWALALLFALQLLLLPASSPTYAQAPPPPLAPQTVRLVADEIQVENLSFGGYFSVNAWVDAAGSKFIAYVRNGYTEAFQAAGVIRKVSSAGQLLASYEILSTRAGKADDIGITPSGTDLYVVLTSHGLNGGPKAILGDKLIRGVFAPYRTGEMPAGAPGVYAEGQAALTEVDYNRIKLEVAAEVIAAIRADLGTSTIRQGIEDKVKDGLGESFDPALYWVDPRAGYAQDAALPWFRDRAFQGAKAALDKVGVCRGP